jgi:hypothetical protein
MAAYNPNKERIFVDTVPITAIPTNGSISKGFLEDKGNITGGVLGGGVPTLNPAEAGFIEFPVFVDSPDHVFLKQLAKSVFNGIRNTAVEPLVCRHENIGSVNKDSATFFDCVPKRIPDSERAQDGSAAPTVTWRFECVRYVEDA